MKRTAIFLLALTACASSAPQLSTQTSTKPTPSLSPAPAAGSTSPAPTSEPSTTPVPDLRWRSSTAAPRTLIVNHGGEIEVRRRDGSVIRTLADRSQTRKLSLSLTLSPNRRTLFFVRYTTENCADIVSVPVSGGSVRTVAHGTSVSLSPDGAHLAYADSWNCGSRRSEAVVRELATGTERRWVDKSGLGGGVAWMPDGRYFIFEECGADSCGPRLIDSRTMQRVDRDAYQLPDYIDHMNAFVSGPILRGDTGALVLHVNYSSEDGTEPHPILEYSTKTRVTRAVFERSRGAGVLDFDVSGDHMLYKTQDGRLFWYDGSRARLVTTGITSAVW